tara:strand:+ start:889 stop:1548 length:660 start_codon:yes stop_codon:yes gene_type:complete
MAYYLGRDVKVMITTESTESGVHLDGSNDLELRGSRATTAFANMLDATSAGTTYALSDLTGVDLSIGSVDEDITYMGQRSVLKAEIKKETTVTLTRKKSGMLWDKVFNGGTNAGDPIVAGSRDHGARWGVCNDSSDVVKISDGLRAPADSIDDSGNICYGYRVFVQLSSGETISVPNCCVVSHTVTLNADGTTEETMEFMTYITPYVGASADVTRTTSA